LKTGGNTLDSESTLLVEELVKENDERRQPARKERQPRRTLMPQVNNSAGEQVRV